MTEVADKGVRSPESHLAWARLWARYIDLVIYVLPLATMGGAFIPASATWDGRLLTVLLLPLTIPISALVISAFGTSIGLMIAGLRIETASGKNIPFATNLKREFRTYLAMGLGIPIVGLFTLSTSYNELKENGISSWDKDYRTRVVSRGSTPARTWIAAIIYIVISVLFSILSK